MRRADALKNTCPKCGAPPSLPCMGLRGARKACHSERHPKPWDGKRPPNQNVRANRKNEMGWVYFIGPVTAECIKIGWSAKHPEKRLKQLQTGNSEALHLFGAVKGSQHLETALHQHWQHLSIRGEWFRLDEVLYNFISESSELEEGE